jgi:hypothetical protein
MKREGPIPTEIKDKRNFLFSLQIHIIILYVVELEKAQSG